jgi:hypothetical protein
MISLNVKTEPCIDYRVLILTHLVRFIVSSLALQGMQKYISLRKATRWTSAGRQCRHRKLNAMTSYIRLRLTLRARNSR